MMLSFAITGFSHFPGCSVNPTESLVAKLQIELARRGLDALVCEVLPVSAEFVDRWLSKTAQQLPVGRRIIWVHFGVDKEGKHCKLEAQAYNDATFREPDEDGWKPQHEPIDSSPMCPHDTCLHTHLPLDQISGKLQRIGHDVQISHSAGRYLCNYIYFRSLQRCSSMPHWHALFVHVPPVAFLDEGRQLQLALDLFDQLAGRAQARVPALNVV